MLSHCLTSLTPLLLQDKYTDLSLAFRTDMATLKQRLNMHKRARDTIEQNIHLEMDGLKAAMTVGGADGGRR